MKKALLPEFFSYLVLFLMVLITLAFSFIFYKKDLVNQTIKKNMEKDIFIRKAIQNQISNQYVCFLYDYEDSPLKDVPRFLKVKDNVFLNNYKIRVQSVSSYLYHTSQIQSKEYLSSQIRNCQVIVIDSKELIHNNYKKYLYDLSRIGKVVIVVAHPSINKDYLDDDFCFYIDKKHNETLSYIIEGAFVTFNGDHYSIVLDELQGLSYRTYFLRHKQCENDPSFNSDEGLCIAELGNIYPKHIITQDGKIIWDSYYFNSKVLFKERGQFYIVKPYFVYTGFMITDYAPSYEVTFASDKASCKQNNLLVIMKIRPKNSDTFDRDYPYLLKLPNSLGSIYLILDEKVPLSVIKRIVSEEFTS